MKGIILAGGKGTRLHPLTLVTNKHLLPVFDRPMIFFPLATLRRADIREVLIVTNPEFLSDFQKLLGDGKRLGVKLTFAVQKKADGIAGALRCAEKFAAGASVAVILGDNIFADNFSAAVRKFKIGAQVFLKRISDPHRFGVPTLCDTHVIKITEKPRRPASNFAVTGFYLFDHRVFEIVRKIKPSRRGELEITDVNNFYIQRSELNAQKVRGFWSDAGTPESLLRAANFCATKKLY